MMRMMAAAVRAFRVFTPLLLAVMALMAAAAVPARADAMEGLRSYAAGRKDEAIRLLRRAAWQENDFLAQIKLGEIYSAKVADDKNFEDRAEAFVWFYMAARNPNIVEHLHVEEAAQYIVDAMAMAEREARTIYSTLLQDERIEVRNRIIYIQGCMGAGGHMRLGMYYDPNIAERHQSGSLQGSSMLRPIVRPFHQKYTPGTPLAGPQGVAPLRNGDAAGVAAPVGRWAGDICRDSTWWGWLFGDPLKCAPGDPDGSSSSVFAVSAVEALMHYHLASRFAPPNNPLPAKYIASIIATAETPEEGKKLDEIAKGKAKRWLSPFEFYASESRGRGETLSGLVHSDECPVDGDRGGALAVADRTISPDIRMDMLKFLNFHRADGLPASVAVKKFQDFLGDPETGVMTAVQTVRLFQIAAVRGYVRAQRCLGIMYLKGIGVEKDAVRGEYWLLKAAEQGDGEAMYALSELYSLGADGVEKMEDKASRYRQGAAIAGFNPVKAEFLRLLETAPVRGDEQATPIKADVQQDDGAEQATPVVRPRDPPKRPKKRRRPRYTPPADDGPFGE
jgi:TPR repeat protein